MDAEFISGTTTLTIGAENENPAFDTVRTERGMEYRIHGSIIEGVFGIAFIINGCVGLLQNWMDNGLRKFPEEIFQLAGAIIQASMKS